MPQIDQETLKRMKSIAEMRRKGDLRSAYLEMEKLPPAIADSRFILVQRASLANESGDDAGYRQYGAHGHQRPARGGGVASAAAPPRRRRLSQDARAAGRAAR